MNMVTQARNAQKAYNATHNPNPAITTNSFAPMNIVGNDSNPTTKKSKKTGVATGKKSKGKRLDVGDDSTIVTVGKVAPISGGRIKADQVLIEGIHTTISKAKGAKITIEDPHSHGCVVGHNVSFERGCFQSINLHYEGLSSGSKVAEVFSSLVFMDTMRLVADGLMHPLSHGSNSLKKLVPALVPSHGNQYSDLAIADGNAAAAVYRDWLVTMTQRLPQQQQLNQSMHPPPVAPPNASAGDLTQNASSATITQPPPPNPHKDYQAYALQLATYNKEFDAKRKDLIAYCETDTSQMVSVIKEVARIARLASSLAEAKDPKCVELGKGWLGLPLDQVVSTRLESEKAN